MRGPRDHGRSDPPPRQSSRGMPQARLAALRLSSLLAEMAVYRWRQLLLRILLTSSHSNLPLLDAKKTNDISSVYQTSFC